MPDVYPAGWSNLSLDALGTIERGRSRHRPRNAEHLYGGQYPFIQTGDVKAAGLRVTASRQTYSDAGLAQSRLWPVGTLCITIAANICETTILGIKACFPDSIVGFTADPKKCDTAFVKYALDQQRARFSAISKGTTQENLSVEKLLTQRFPVPPLPEQRRIASILSAYDDLIEVNRRRVAILEEMARRLFEEWFVHLRFPGHDTVPVHGTPHGPLPEGWGFQPFGQLVSETRDGVVPADISADTVYVGLEHIPRRSTTLTEWGQAGDVTSAKLRFRRGDILFGKIRPYFHKVAVAPTAGVCSTDAIVLRSHHPRYAGLATMIASSDAFVAQAVQTSNGTKMPRANWTVLARYAVRLPPAPLLDQFNSIVVDSLDQAIALAAANARLAAARDLLLPRLVSGELSVADTSTPARLLEAAE